MEGFIEINFKKGLITWIVAAGSSFGDLGKAKSEFNKFTAAL